MARARAEPAAPSMWKRWRQRAAFHPGIERAAPPTRLVARVADRATRGALGRSSRGLQAPSVRARGWWTRRPVVSPCPDAIRRTRPRPRPNAPASEREATQRVALSDPAGNVDPAGSLDPGARRRAIQRAASGRVRPARPSQRAINFSDRALDLKTRSSTASACGTCSLRTRACA